MAIDPVQVIAMQQALTGGLGGGMPGAYGAALPAFGGLLQPQSLVGKTNQFGIPIPPFSPGHWLRRFGIGNIPIPRSSLPAGGSIAGGQLAPQGAIGNFLGRLRQPLSHRIATTLGIPQLGQQIGQGLGGLATLLPFGVDRLTAAYGGGQLVPQGFGRLISPIVRPRNIPFGPIGRLITYGVDSLTAAYASGQLAPQGFGGGLLQPQTTFGPNPIDLFRRFHGFPPWLLRPRGSISGSIINL